MRNPQYFTAGQAAKAAGVSKTTISNALKSGRLSYIEKTKSGYHIDPAELFRVFTKPSNLDDSTNGNGQLNRTVNAEIAIELGRVQAERDALQKQVDDLRHNLSRAEDNADQWREQAQRLAITHKVRRPFWERIFKR